MLQAPLPSLKMRERRHEPQQFHIQGVFPSIVSKHG